MNADATTVAVAIVTSIAATLLIVYLLSAPRIRLYLSLGTKSKRKGRWLRLTLVQERTRAEDAQWKGELRELQSVLDDGLIEEEEAVEGWTRGIARTDDDVRLSAGGADQQED